MEFTISVLQEQNRIPEVIELFRTGLGDTSEAHWRWRLFTDNGQEDRPFAVIADDENGRMVGVSAVFPARYGCTQKKCVAFGDWVVHPDYRGQGLIRKIFDFTCAYFVECGYDFMLTFPNEMSYPILKRYGFRDLSGVTNWNSRTKLFLSHGNPKDQTVSGVEYRYTRHCALEEIPKQREDRLYRTTAYLRWKYDQNPDQDYTWLTLWQRGEPLGYFVYTLMKGRLRTAVNVYDWDYWQGDVAIFAQAVKQLKQLGSFVSFWGIYAEDLQALLRQAGLEHLDGATKCIVREMHPTGLPEQLTITRVDTDY